MKEVSCAFYLAARLLFGRRGCFSRGVEVIGQGGEGIAWRTRKYLNKVSLELTIFWEAIQMTMLADILIIGVVATIFADAYDWLLERLVNKMRGWHLVGRWLVGLFKGSFVLDITDETKKISGENLLGWVFHYIVGVAYAAIYLFAMQFVLVEPPSLATAVGFGVITVAAPWFILMPGLGFGLLATKAPKPNFARLASLSVHTVFGLGLYLGLVAAGLLSI